MKHLEYNHEAILKDNGWQEVNSDDPLEYANYEIKMQDSLVRAYISMRPEHLSAYGYYGVLWLGVTPDRKVPFYPSDINDMTYDLDAAEANLLRIGMPFEPEYKFAKWNTKEKAEYRRRRNAFLRKVYDIEKKEEKGYEILRRRG